MGSTAASALSRAPRSDALRNRERLLSAATAAFSEAEDGDAPSLDAIARRAGVGIGTLYRHFPTREDLVVAVYRSELDAVCDAATRLAAERPPVEAMRAWMDRYARFVAAKHGMAESLRPLLGSESIPADVTRTRVIAAVDTILGAGVDAGAFRPDVRGSDVSAALLGIFLATGLGLGPENAVRRGDLEGVRRMMETVLQGIRSRPDE